MSITISVLLSVYNTPVEYVKRAIKSVLNQDFQNFELIVIDDGSDQKNKTDIFEFVSLHQNKISYFYHKNQGQSASINRCVAFSKGTYITVIDADDEFKINHLSSCLKEMDSVDLIASTTETIVDSENDYFVPDKHNNHEVVHVDDCILFATLFGKSEIFKKHQFKSMYAADAAFYERVAQEYKVKKVNLRTYIYYRNIPTSISASLKSEILERSRITKNHASIKA